MIFGNTSEYERVVSDTNTSISMVTDPVVMVISFSVSNKESVISLIAPASDCRKILVYQKSISIWSLIDKIVRHSTISWFPDGHFHS